MNIDERLERLAERHEALSQSVEILSRGVMAMQKSMQDMFTMFKDLAAAMRSMRNFGKDIADSTARLLQIAQIHENRIAKLEGGD